jgi:hypothetical protein
MSKGRRKRHRLGLTIVRADLLMFQPQNPLTRKGPKKKGDQGAVTVLEDVGEGRETKVARGA